VTDWSGHIDVLVGAGIIITAQIIFDAWVFKRIRSIIRYKDSRMGYKWH
jgi:hypothetical protein